MKVPVVKLKKPPKADQLDMEQIEAIASMGLIDEEISIILKISPRTLNYWKKKSEAFRLALKRGKLIADFKMTQSLYKKGLGYEVPDLKTRKMIKVPGETTAMIFWLKNRRPDLWRDKQDVDAPGIEKALYEISNSFLPDMRRRAKTRSDEPK
jgi:hypothetical protein